MAIKFEGLENVLDGIEKIGDTSRLEGAIGKACALVEAEAKKKAPKVRSFLRLFNVSSRIHSGR